MTDPLTLALGEDRLADLHAELDDLRAEVQAHRDGIGHLAEDPMHAGQPVHVEYRYTDGEPVYRLQVAHAGIPLWRCNRCGKLTIGYAPNAWNGRFGMAAAACVICGIDETLEPLLYPEAVECRQVTGRQGPCLIAGSDGCECPEEAK